MKLGDSLAQEFKPFADKIELSDRNSGNVAARMIQTLNQAVADRIERHGKNDRNCRCRLF